MNVQKKQLCCCIISISEIGIIRRAQFRFAVVTGLQTKPEQKDCFGISQINIISSFNLKVNNSLYFYILFPFFVCENLIIEKYYPIMFYNDVHRIKSITPISEMKNAQGRYPIIKIYVYIYNLPATLVFFINIFPTKKLTILFFFKKKKTLIFSL